MGPTRGTIHLHHHAQTITLSPQREALEAQSMEDETPPIEYEAIGWPFLVGASHDTTDPHIPLSYSTGEPLAEDS